MSQFETTGGGYIDSGDRRVIRKVVVATGGAQLSIPQTEEGFPLSNVSVSDEAGGVRRAVLEYSQGGAGGSSFNQYGKRIELTGGTREVPIQTHPTFKDLTETQLAELFEQTVRIDADGRSRLTAGSIYLPLAYQLALRQNGRLSAANAEAGATFTLSLPLFPAN